MSYTYVQQPRLKYGLERLWIRGIIPFGRALYKAPAPKKQALFLP